VSNCRPQYFNLDPIILIFWIRLSDGGIECLDIDIPSPEAPKVEGEERRICTRFDRDEVLSIYGWLGEYLTKEKR